MFNVSIDIDNLKGLSNYLEYVERVSNFYKDTEFQDFMKQKFLEVVEKVTNQRVVGGTTNDEEIDLYKQSHKIIDFVDEKTGGSGFILYNDAKIPADKYNTLPFDTSGYPNGDFSIALAFEYGTGMVGAGSYTSDNFTPWNYNKVANTRSKHHKGRTWYLPKNVLGESGQYTSGYEGFEVYRFAAEEIKANLLKWVKDYTRKYRGVSK